MSDKKKKKSGLAVACCLLGILVVFILFLVKKDEMVTNLKETDFFGRVFGTTPDFVQNHVLPENNEELIPLQKEVPLTINFQEDIKSDVLPLTENIVSEKKEEKNDETNKSEPKTEKKESVNEKQELKSQKKEYTTYQLCFVEVDAVGSVNRKMIKRTVEKNDSPLTTSLNLLLKGPETKNSEEKNCMSLIPEGTKLLSAKVSDGVAYLNFNDAFEINPIGVEGYIGQLMQIVYTATTFSTVKSVQFLIEGKKIDYLGSEGQWIGTPLNRNSFSK